MMPRKFPKNESISSLHAEMHSNMIFAGLVLISTEHFFNPFRHHRFAFHHIAFKSFSIGRHWNSDCIVKITLRKQSMHERRFIGEAHESSSSSTQATGT